LRTQTTFINGMGIVLKFYRERHNIRGRPSLPFCILFDVRVAGWILIHSNQSGQVAETERHGYNYVEIAYT